ncbi:MAG: tetratricopeptide repeat protein [Candidatus Ozemobacteraceae bacterium]
MFRELKPFPAFFSLAIGCALFSVDGYPLVSGNPVWAARAAKSGTSAPKAPSKKRKTGESSSSPSSSDAKSAVPQILTGSNSYEGIWSQFDGGDETAQRQAVTRMKALLKKSPDDGYAHYYLGLMQLQLGPLNQAEEHLRFAAEAYPDAGDITLKLAQTLIDQGRMDEAAPLLEKARTLDPKSAGPLSLLGLKALSEGDLKKAVELLVQARDIDSENRDTLRGLGMAYVGLERPAEGVEALTRVLALEDNDAEAHYQLGKAYEALGKAREAAEHFEKAKKLGRGDTDLKGLIGYDLARTLAQSGRNDAAVSEYQKAIKSASDPTSGWFELAELYENIGQNTRAVSAFKKAFESGNRSDAAFRVGEIHRKEGNIEEACNSFSLISRRKDEWGERAKSAIEELQQEKCTNTRDALVEQAASGDEAAKEKAFFKMLQDDPKDPDALRGLKELAMTRGDYGHVEFYNKQLIKAGLLDKSDAAMEKAKLEDRSNSGDDLGAWENRFEEFKQHEEYDKALVEWKKMRAYSDSQLDYWKKQKDSEGKSAMIKATKNRIRTLNEMAKDLREQKKWHKKK